MIKKILLLLCLGFFFSSILKASNQSPKVIKRIVTSLKKIRLNGFYNAYNPSLVKFENEFILTFRVDQRGSPWINRIGIIILDENFEPICEPQLLATREADCMIPSQSQDARIFLYLNELYILYNDNIEVLDPTIRERRDMYLAKLIRQGNSFIVQPAIKLRHEHKYQTTLWQKNWVPFEWENKLMLAYSLSPHEILLPELTNGLCQSLYCTDPFIDWQWGKPRGGTPALMVDGEYMAFFHSSNIITSVASKSKRLIHYYMGAYTFSPKPPFQITSVSVAPILESKFYLSSNAFKRVVFPGGLVDGGSYLYVAYGKDDRCIRIATIDKTRLRAAMKKIK